MDTEEVAAVEEDMMAIHISPTTPGAVLISEIFFRDFSSANFDALQVDGQSYVSRQRIRENYGGRCGNNGVCGVHSRGGGRYQKLKLFGKTPAMEDVVAEDVVHIIALNLEEDIIDS